MRQLRLALRDLSSEFGWLLLLGAVMSLVAFGLARTMVIIAPAAQERSLIERFEAHDPLIVSVDVPPFETASEESRVSSWPDLTAPESLGELLSQGKAGTYVTVYGVPEGCEGVPAEMTVVFLGAYVELTRYETGGAPVALAVSRDLEQFGGTRVQTGGQTVRLGVVPENMDIYHPMYYETPYSVAHGKPRTVFAFVQDFALACEVIPGLEEEPLLDRLLLFGVSEQDVADLRKDVLSASGMIVGVMTLEEQMANVEQSGNGAGASYLTFFGAATVVLVAAMALGMLRSLLRRVSEYAVHHAVGATLGEVWLRMVLFSAGYLVIPLVVTMLALSSAGVMTAPVAAGALLVATALVGGSSLAALRRVAAAVSEGEREGWS